MICSDPEVVNMAALLTLRDSNTTAPTWHCPTTDEIGIQSVRYFHQDPTKGPKVYAHLDGANKAIDYLRQRNIHLPFKVDRQCGALGFEEKFLLNNISNLTVRGRFDNGVKKMETPLVRIIFLVFTQLYGCSHLSAWNFHFPIFVEMWI